jgi:hypothetical protein
MSKFLFLLFISINISLFSQNTYYGIVFDLNTNKPISGCSIYNINTDRGTITNEEGKFMITGNIGDMIQASYIGKQTEFIYITESTKFIQFELLQYIKQIKPAIIRHENLAKNSVVYQEKEEDVEIKRNIFNPKSYFSNPINAISSPISMLYYAFNKKEKRRLNALVLIQKREIANQKYNRDYISSILRINDPDELDEIIRFCYFSEDEILDASMYELSQKLKACYFGYKQFKETKEKKNRFYKLELQQKKIDSMIKIENNSKNDSLLKSRYEELFGQ